MCNKTDLNQSLGMHKICLKRSNTGISCNGWKSSKNLEGILRFFHDICKVWEVIIFKLLNLLIWLLIKFKGKKRKQRTMRIAIFEKI